MPNRIIREGILDSREINALPEAAEILYRRLMSIVDDYGRYEADPELIRARCFARQLDRWPLSRVSQALSDVSQSPALISIYEVGGKMYLQINKFQQRTRSESKCPSPNDGQMTVNWQTHDGSRATSPTTHTSPNTDNVSENENARDNFLPARKVVESVRLSDASQRFAEFWGLYPLKTGEDLACQIWLSLVSLANEAAVFACLNRYLASDHVSRGVVMAPRNWLHDCARDKWACEWPAASKPNGKVDALEMIEELKRRDRQNADKQRRA